ncbi:uncharacterized protein LOC141652723 [Silene latifolia]|uniref:uncharacterized protein LOC141652723 n=1 Tax=Silene latifolia TaxID=37657 RepID=UPI003D77059E
MAEENIDKTIASEELQSETDVIMKNIGSHEVEPSEQRDTDCDVATSESTDRLSDETDDVVKEEGEDLKRDNQSGDSTIKKPSPDHKVTVRSRYRRASTGSCHDACKYGHKHEFERTPKKPLMGIIRENRPLKRTTSGENLARTVKEKEIKDKELNRRLSLPGTTVDKKPRNPSSKTDVTNSPKKVASPQSKLKNVQTEVKPPLVRSPWSSFGRSKIDIPAAKKTTKDKSSQKDKDITSKEAGSSSDSKKVKAKETVTNSSGTLLKKSGSIRARLYKDFKSFSRSRRMSSSEDTKVSTSSDVREKPNLLSNEESPSSPVKPRKSNVTRKGSRFGLPSFSLTSTSKSASSAARRSVHPRGDRGLGPSTEEGGSKTNTPRAKAAVNIKPKVKKTGISRSEEKDGSAWKVKFKRGTVVNLQVASNSPRKLRFKRGKILGEDQNGKADDKNLKNNDTGNESRDTRPEHEKVQLRRQEGSAKKDNVDMNNVIEETASKLVKTRKSKVKALVGAFETVMSFRDRKPLVETTAS